MLPVFSVECEETSVSYNYVASPFEISKWNHERLNMLSILSMIFNLNS